MKKMIALVFALGLMGLVMTPVAQAKERHPKIKAAIHALEVAKMDMNKAAHDFGGHKASALDACDKAIAELKACLEYDKK